MLSGQQPNDVPAHPPIRCLIGALIEAKENAIAIENGILEINIIMFIRLFQFINNS